MLNYFFYDKIFLVYKLIKKNIGGKSESLGYIPEITSIELSGKKYNLVGCTVHARESEGNKNKNFIYVDGINKDMENDFFTLSISNNIVYEVINNNFKESTNFKLKGNEIIYTPKIGVPKKEGHKVAEKYEKKLEINKIPEIYDIKKKYPNMRDLTIGDFDTLGKLHYLTNINFSEISIDSSGNIYSTNLNNKNRFFKEIIKKYLASVSNLGEAITGVKKIIKKAKNENRNNIIGDKIDFIFDGFDEYVENLQNYNLKN